MKRGPKGPNDWPQRQLSHNGWYWVKAAERSNFEIAKFFDGLLYFVGDSKGYYPQVIEEYLDIPIKPDRKRYDSRYE